MLHSLVQLDESEPLELHVWKVRTRTLGPEHEATLSAMGMVSIVWYSQGRYQEAAEVGQKALETRRKVLGRNHPDTLSSMYDVAHPWNSAGQQRRAKSLMVEYCRRSRRLLGPDNEVSRSSRESLRIWKQETQSNEGG
jgi:Tetratricopeptide repeat